MALYETYSIQGETLSDIAEAIREKTGTEDRIQTTNMSGMIRGIQGGSPDAVLFTEQTLTEEQKAQARENIGAAEEGTVEGAVLYIEQILQPEQKDQARKNIDIHVGEEPQNADDGAIWFDPNGTSLILGNAIMAEDANEGEVEIFGSFISEDTVIAKDENSDGNINLQTFVKGEELKVEYATKEELAALTAEDVGARPNDWMPTIAEIGAAPAGYGYGDYIYAYSEGDAFINEIEAILASTNNGLSKQIRFSVDYKYSQGAAFAGTLAKHSDDWAVLTGSSYNNSMQVVRTKNNGVWQPWEFVNPPMTLGVEYRTTERHNGKAVYTMLVSFGNLPASGSSYVSTGISGGTLVSLTGTFFDSGGGGAEPYPIMSGTGPKCLCWVNDDCSTLFAQAIKDCSGYTGEFIIKYTKD